MPRNAQLTEIDTKDVETLAQRILTESSSRSRRKWWAAWLQEWGTPEIHDAVRALAVQSSGLSETEILDMPFKKVLRRGQGLEQKSQVRTNPIARDEAFRCGHCGTLVPAHGRTARNHCPTCLWSKHVDVAPGDRLSTCRGLMRPIRLEHSNGCYFIVHQCEQCAFERRNRVMMDGAPPDDWNAVTRLSRGSGA